MIEKTVTERLFVFLLTIAVVVAPVSATGGLWQDLGDVGGIWQDLGNLGELWSDSGLGAVFGDTNLDTIPFSGTGASDQPAQWNMLNTVLVQSNIPDDTIIYSNLVQECVDPDGPELVQVVSTHPFSVFLSGNDLRIRGVSSANIGEHQIALDCNGIRASFTLGIRARINQPPVANAGPDRTVNINQAITFDGSASTDTDGTITLFVWNFGDGTSATDRIVQHTFTQTGTFTITLTVTDNDGATDSDTAVITADGRPTAALNCPANGQIGQTLTFDARQSTDNGQITNYHFNFGDGTTASQANPLIAKAYATAGTFTVTLTVTDNDNLTHQMACAVQIIAVAPNQPPLANAGPDRTVSINDVIIFDGSASSDSDGTIVRYEWSFSDGVMLVGQVVQRVFSAVGTFIATLTVTDDDGSTDLDSATIIADGMPTAVLNCPASAFPNKQTVFDASQSTDDTVIVDYSINFGDATTAHSSSAFIVHTYAAVGTYNVLLTVTDDDNLSDTEACTVTVTASPPEEEEDELERLIFSRINFNEIARAGETLEISVTLFNDGPQELEDMRLTAFVYDLDIRAVQGPFELDNGDSETQLLLLNLPPHAQGKFDIEFTASNDDKHLNEYRTITIE